MYELLVSNLDIPKLWCANVFPICQRLRWNLCASHWQAWRGDGWWRLAAMGFRVSPHGMSTSQDRPYRQQGPGYILCGQQLLGFSTVKAVGLKGGYPVWKSGCGNPLKNRLKMVSCPYLLKIIEDYWRVLPSAAVVVILLSGIRACRG